MSDHVDTTLHVKIQTAFQSLIDEGVPPDEVFETALTCAVASKMALHGPRQASRDMYVCAMQLFQLAEQQEAEQTASRH